MEEKQKFWNEISSVEEVDYDDEKVNRLLRWKAIKQNLQGVKKILDVGAATGAFSIPLAKMGYEVTHFDFSPEMMSYAKSKAEGVENIRFALGDATNLCMFRECEFDLVLCFDGAISFAGREADRVIENCCRVGKKVLMTVSNKACMAATWLNYSMNNFGRLHPSVVNMMKTGYFSKRDYDYTDKMTGITEMKAYDIQELSRVLVNNGMRVTECRSIGSLTHLYLLHLYRQHNKIEVHEIINEISMLDEFVELCDFYDRYVMPEGIGSFRRAGILAIAEHAGDAEFFYRDENAPKPNQPNHIGTAVLICCDDKFLVEHRADSDTWALIGGGLKQEETMLECAVREVLEETGISLMQEDLQFVQLYDDPSRIVCYPDGNVMRVITGVYKVELSEVPELICSKESRKLAFVTKEELKQLNLARIYIPIVEDIVK